MLSIKQFLNKVEDDTSIQAITLKLYEQKSQELTKRLTPELNTLYTHGYDGVKATPGMKIYEELEAQMKQMQPLSNFFQAYHASTGELASAAALRREQARCQEAGVRLSRVVSSTICARHFEEQRVNGEYDTCADIVNPASNNEMGLGQLGQDADEQKKELQSSVVLVQVVNVLKVGTEILKDKKEEREAAVVKATDSLHLLMQALKQRSVKILDEDLERDVNRLTLLTDVAVGKSLDQLALRRNVGFALTL
jgi:hypothetical protein